MSAVVPTLYVEGVDDVSVISALLACHGVDTDRGKRHLYIKPTGGDRELLAGLLDAVRASTDRPVGFVLDIDIPCEDRWQSVRGRLNLPSLTLPLNCPPGGFVGTNTDYGQKVGVWLMPDCVTSHQKLEHLCRTLVPTHDVLWGHAEASTADAERRFEAATAAGQRPFPEADRIKAHIHTWLAWQKEPGVRLGAAITAAYLNHNSANARVFLAWLKELFALDQLQLPAGTA